MPDVPILPPGPSEEFLRRQAEFVPPPYGSTASAGSFDPGTGERQSQAFNVQPAPLATSEMQMLEAVRQQVNAMHFKNAQDALNASIQFQHMREAQRMRERGATEQQIMGTLGRGLFYQNNNPYSAARAYQEMSPVPAPSVTNIGGVSVLRSGRFGERATAVPQNALPGNAFVPGKEFTTEGGTVLVQVSPNRVQVVDKHIASGRMTDQEKQQILDLRNEQKQLAKELSDMGGPPKRPFFGGAPSDAEKRYADKIAQLDAITKKRNEIYTHAESRETGKAAPVSPVTKKALDKALALDFLKQAAGDKEKARKLARDAGYEF